MGVALTGMFIVVSEGIAYWHGPPITRHDVFVDFLSSRSTDILFMRIASGSGSNAIRFVPLIGSTSSEGHLKTNFSYIVLMAAFLKCFFYEYSTEFEL